MVDEDPASEGHVERLRTALAGLGPEQSERLVRMVELGAMICLVEEAAAGRGFAGSKPPAFSAPSFSPAGELGRSGRRQARTRTRAHAGTT